MLKTHREPAGFAGFMSDGADDESAESQLALMRPVEPAGQAAEDSYLVFQVVNIKLSAKKFAHCDTSKQRQATDVAVVQYRVVRFDHESK